MESTIQASYPVAPTSASADYTEHRIARGPYQIYARDYPGHEPAIILMHGFPDNLHLYDRLVPWLAKTRRVITFDFLGWGNSDKPNGYPYTADNQTWDLASVISHFKLDSVVLVAHDASGPPAIDWALAHPTKTAGLVLLNTYYCLMPKLRAPEAIFLFSTPVLRNVARFVSNYFGIFHKLYLWQVGQQFIRDDEVRKQIVPLLYGQFATRASVKPAFFRLNEDLLPTLRNRSEKQEQLKTFQRPVRIIFGERDPYLNSAVARQFHELFPVSDLFLLKDAKHFVQLDEPEEVARLIVTMPHAPQQL